ncbi:hypothetical protein NKH77_44160 [Streptomyces sp. M19]
MIVGADREELLGGLDALAQGGASPVCSPATRPRRPASASCSPGRAASAWA